MPLGPLLKTVKNLSGGSKGQRYPCPAGTGELIGPYLKRLKWRLSGASGSLCGSHKETRDLDKNRRADGDVDEHTDGNSPGFYKTLSPFGPLPKK